MICTVIFFKQFESANLTIVFSTTSARSVEARGKNVAAGRLGRRHWASISQEPMLGLSRLAWHWAVKDLPPILSRNNHRSAEIQGSALLGIQNRSRWEVWTTIDVKKHAKRVEEEGGTLTLT
jgi:hypothetical protein